jgi:transposase-like protein
MSDMILRKADACQRPGELGALLRREGLYSSHLVTWRRQRAHGLAPKPRGRKKVAVDPRVKKLEQENRRLTSRLERAEAIIAFQKKVAELLGIPLKPFAPDETD